METSKKNPGPLDGKYAAWRHRLESSNDGKIARVTLRKEQRGCFREPDEIDVYFGQPFDRQRAEKASVSYGLECFKVIAADVAQGELDTVIKFVLTDLMREWSDSVDTEVWFKSTGSHVVWRALRDRRDELVIQSLTAKDREVAGIAPVEVSLPLDSGHERTSYSPAPGKLVPVEQEAAANGSGQQALKWEAVEIIFTSDQRVQYFVEGGTSETLNYADMGFKDGRSGKENKAWDMMRELAKREGRYGTKNTGANTARHSRQHPSAVNEKQHREQVDKWSTSEKQPWTRIEKRMQEIRKTLQKHFGIAGDPVPYVDGTGYVARFKIRCGPSFLT
jgi:hypothetical protein